MALTTTNSIAQAEAARRGSGNDLGNLLRDIIETLDALSDSEIAVLDGVTAGTVTASKAVVVDANKDIGDFRNLDAVNVDAGASGTAGSVDVFPATAAKGKTTFTATDNAGNTTTTINTAAQAGARTYTIPDAGASASMVMTEGAQTVNGVKTFGSVPVFPAGGFTAGSTTITEAEAGVLDGVTPGTQAASKAVVADANVNTGVSKVTELHIGASGSETQVTATAAEINALDLTTGAGTSEASKAMVLDANSKLDGLPLVKRSLTALTTTNLENLAGTPIEVIPAPGSGKFIQVLGWRFRLIFGATAIDDAAGDGNLTLIYAGGSTIDTMEADGLVDAAATTQGLSGNLTELIVAESGIDNVAVQISNDGAEFTVVGGGDSTAEVEVFYRILDTNPS